MGTDEGEPRNVEALVRAAARDLDHDRYLATLLAPAAARDDLMALTAFCAEIARIPQTVREPAVGDIRLQWWRDALALPAQTLTGNPVADALRAAMHARALPREMLETIIDAYAQELEGGSLTTAASLEAHLAATHGGALHLAARILGEPRPSADPLLHAAAQAWGRVQLLRALPLLASQGRNPFGDESADVYVPSLLRQAGAELATARQRVTSAPATLRPALLPLALVEPYLKALQGLGPDVAKQRAEISPLTRAWRLLKANALGRV